VGRRAAMMASGNSVLPLHVAFDQQMAAPRCTCDDQSLPLATMLTYLASRNGAELHLQRLRWRQCTLSSVQRCRMAADMDRQQT
jgi:hypothetical protein